MRTFLCLTLLACFACRTETSSTPAGGTTAFVTRTSAVEAWELWEDGRKVGSVVRYAHANDAQKAFFSVRNVHGQALGMVDLEGRAWRLRAHREPDWLGTGTVASGTRSILGAGPNAQLIEVALEQLSAAAGRAPPL